MENLQEDIYKSSCLKLKFTMDFVIILSQNRQINFIIAKLLLNTGQSMI